MRRAYALPVAALLLAGVASAQTPPRSPGTRPSAGPAKPAKRAGAQAAPASPAAPPVPVSIKVVAPSARGQWLLRIDNQGEGPLLVSADVRLLRFEIHRWDAKRGEYASKGEVCDGPAAFGLEAQAPFGRELVLERGESYVEAFDPRLICFGKQASLLEPGVVVMPTYGFAPAPRPAWKKEVAEVGPFVADTAASPRAFGPIKRLVAGSVILEDAPPATFPASEQAPSAQELPPPSAEAASRPSPLERAPYQTPKDGLAAAMSLTTDRFADARTWREVAFEVEAHNVGERPIWAALRARQLSFMVYGADGEAYCPRVSQDHHVPRDMFEKLEGGKHRHIPVRLAESCLGQAFQRPGLYAVVPTLHADENGAEYGLVALTGTVSTRDPGKVGGTHVVDDDATLVRVRSGPLPFYASAPRATLTTTPVPPTAAGASPVTSEAPGRRRSPSFDAAETRPKLRGARAALR